MPNREGIAASGVEGGHIGLNSTFDLQEYSTWFVGEYCKRTEGNC